LGGESTGVTTDCKTSITYQNHFLTHRCSKSFLDSTVRTKGTRAIETKDLQDPAELSPKDLAIGSLGNRRRSNCTTVKLATVEAKDRPPSGRQVTEHDPDLAITGIDIGFDVENGSILPLALRFDFIFDIFGPIGALVTGTLSALQRKDADNLTHPD
jgi:hypothetical protein